jgi:hypothetical protein
MKARHVAGIVWLTAGVAATVSVSGCGTQVAGQPARPHIVATATAVPASRGTASPAVSVTASQPPGTPPPDTPPPVLTGPATLTVADSGVTIRMHPGQRVNVELAAQGAFSWHVPAAAGAAVTRISASGGYPGRRPARATFLAVRAGTATLTAIDDTACLHTQPACLPAQQAWQVTILVTGS